VARHCPQAFKVVAEDSRSYDHIAFPIRQNTLCVAIALADEDLVREILDEGADLWQDCPAFARPLNIALELETTTMLDFMLFRDPLTAMQQFYLMQAVKEQVDRIDWDKLRDARETGGCCSKRRAVVKRFIRGCLNSSDSLQDLLCEMLIARC
jgi:hypothetical protein